MNTTQISNKPYNAARLAAIMNNLIRYCTTPSLIKESVSDHAFLISFLIIETSTEYKELFKYVSREKLLIRATLHDMVETVTGDIPAPAKRALPECESLFDRIEAVVSDSLCEGRDEEFRKLLLGAISFDDLDDIEQTLFKVFDYFCVLLKASNEIYLGNKYYKRVVREMTFVMNNLANNIHVRLDKPGYKELWDFYSDVVDSFLKGLIERAENI